MAPYPKALWVICLTVFLDLLSFGMVIPILQIYAHDFGVSWERTGWLLSIYSVMQLIFAPLWGRVSDRVGRRPVLLVSIFGSCASQLGYALAPSFTMLLVARGLAGVCGANVGAAQAYVADITDERARAGALGIVGAALGLGFVFGPFIGGELGRVSVRLPFFCASALAAVNFLLALWLIKEPVRPGGRAQRAHGLSLTGLGEVLADRRLAGLMLLFLIVTFGFSIMEGTLAPYCTLRFGFDRQHIGRLFALAGVVIVLVQGGAVRRLVPRLGERWLVLCGVALLGAGFSLLGTAEGRWQLWLGMVVMATGSGLNNPALSALISRLAGGHQGSVLGVSQAMGSLGRILGPLAGTAMFVRGPAQPFALAAACMAGALLCGLWLVPRTVGGPSPAQAPPLGPPHG